MASRIKGITVEIGGDTTKLEQSLKSVNSTIKSTQSQLKDVIKLLKLDPKNTELLSQKQRLLKDAVQATKKTWKHLRRPRSRQSTSFRMVIWGRTSIMPCRGRTLRLKRNLGA